ncbi:MAG: hypothetical protein ACRC0L_07490, partial [Angustibacter sp.]
MPSGILGLTFLLALIGSGVGLASAVKTPGGVVATLGGSIRPTFVPPEPEECSVIPDPTTNEGCLTPRTLVLANWLEARDWAPTCWDEHAWAPKSDHPKGRACDVFPGPGGQRPSAAQKARGDKLAATLKAGAPKNNVSYIIWYGRIWSVEKADQGWRTYDGGGVYDPDDIIGGHFDHLHISM